jgi:hypothetical protein
VVVSSFPGYSSFCRLRRTDGLTDGVLNVQFAQTLAKGKGKIHGVDASEAMIAAAEKAAASDAVAQNVCTFEGLLHSVARLE